MSSTTLDGATVLDAVFRNRNDLFLKCCPGIINFCLSSCRLKTSTTQTPKRAQRARWRVQKWFQERDKPSRGKKCRKPQPIVKKMSFSISKKIRVWLKQGKRDRKLLNQLRSQTKMTSAHPLWSVLREDPENERWFTWPGRLWTKKRAKIVWWDASKLELSRTWNQIQTLLWKVGSVKKTKLWIVKSQKCPNIVS